MSLLVIFSLCLLFVGSRNYQNSAFSTLEMLHIISNIFSLLLLNPFAVSEVLTKIAKTFNLLPNMLKNFSAKTENDGKLNVYWSKFFI